MPHSANNSTSTQAKASRPSSTSTFSGNVFPKQAGANLAAGDQPGEEFSPPPSQFSFGSLAQEAEDDQVRQYRQNSRSTLGDRVGSLRPRGSRSRQQFYEDSFSYKDGTASSARERVTKDAPIIAELRTNVIIKDEYTLVTDLSHHLSTRYQRPESSIMITVNHSACLLLGGSFEPTYVFTISALAVQVQPTTNKRNAALIQNFMAESIGVSPDRGIIKFLPIPEESLAMNGMTILGEIERLERQHAEETGGNIKSAMRRGSRKSSVFKAKSSIQLARNDSKADQFELRSSISPAVPIDGPLDSGIAVNEKGVKESTPRKASESKISNKHSEPLLSKFGRKASVNTQMVAPATPDDQVPPPVITKRKSIFSVFHR